jgi:hypothetical protein
MIEAVCEPCGEVAADEGVPAGWRCANPECRATTASKRRGPSYEFCSKNKCKDLAKLALATLKEDAKDRHIAELKKQLREQATTIALLKQQVAKAHAAPIHRSDAASSSKVAAAVALKGIAVQQPAAKPATSAPQKQSAAAPRSTVPRTAVAVAPPNATTMSTTTTGTAAAAGTRRPLAALSLNPQQQPAQQLAKKAKPSEPTFEPICEPISKVWQQCGWTTRPSRSRPGESMWVHEKLDLVLAEAPTIRKDDGVWHIHVPLMQAIIEASYLKTGPIKSFAKLNADFEACVPLKEGAVGRHPSLRSALKVAREEALSEMAADWSAAGDELCEWLEEAPDALAGRAVNDAIVAMWGWSEARTRRLFANLAEEGRIYSTTDSDHFAVRVAPVSPVDSPSPAGVHTPCPSCDETGSDMVSMDRVQSVSGVNGPGAGSGV